MMKQKIWFIAALAIVLFSTGCDQSANLPDACSIVSREYIQDLLSEPVEEVQPIESRFNAYSACGYRLRVRGYNIKLELYMLPPLPSRDQLQVQQLAAQWAKEQEYDSDFDIITGEYPMVWFPGKIARYPSALLVPFDKTTLVIRGLRRDNGKSLAFTAMQRNGWK